MVNIIHIEKEEVLEFNTYVVYNRLRRPKHHLQGYQLLLL